MQAHEQEHWLVRPATVRGLWWGGVILLALTIAAQFVVPFKGYFGIDGWLAFGAVFGFIACAALVLLAKALGILLKRSERYYEVAPGDDEDGLHDG